MTAIHKGILKIEYMIQNICVKQDQLRDSKLDQLRVMKHSLDKGTSVLVLMGLSESASDAANTPKKNK